MPPARPAGVVRSKAFRAHAVQGFSLSAAFVAVRADAKVPWLRGEARERKICLQM